MLVMMIKTVLVIVIGLCQLVLFAMFYKSYDKLKIGFKRKNVGLFFTFALFILYLILALVAKEEYMQLCVLIAFGTLTGFTSYIFLSERK